MLRACWVPHRSLTIECIEAEFLIRWSGDCVLCNRTGLCNRSLLVRKQSGEFDRARSSDLRGSHVCVLARVLGNRSGHTIRCRCSRHLQRCCLFRLCGLRVPQTPTGQVDQTRGSSHVSVWLRLSDSTTGQSLKSQRKLTRPAVFGRPIQE